MGTEAGRIGFLVLSRRRFQRSHIEHARLREDAQAKFGGFFGVVVEPEE